MKLINKKIKENKQVEIHLWDFPDTIYFLIEPNMRKIYFNKIYSYHGSKRSAARNLGINLSTIRNYEKAFSIKYKIKHPQYTPIRFFKKTLHLFNQKFLEKLEKNVVAISTRNGFDVKNPKLPIRESPELYNIIGHMIADGSAPKRSTPYYVNSCQRLRDIFKKNLKVIGTSEISEYQDGNKVLVNFSKALTDILSDFFDIHFTFPNRIPKLVFNSPLKCKTAFLQSLFDDDGTMTAQLIVGIHNLNIMEEIKSLINSVGVNTNEVLVHRYTSPEYIHKKDKVTLTVPPREYENFRDLIGFAHPEKSKKLDIAIKVRYRKQRTRDPNYIQKRILKILQNKPSKTMELANGLLFTRTGIMPHLELLLKKELIEKKGFKNESIWHIKQTLTTKYK